MKIYSEVQILGGMLVFVGEVEANQSSSWHKVSCLLLDPWLTKRMYKPNHWGRACRWPQIFTNFGAHQNCKLRWHWSPWSLQPISVTRSKEPWNLSQIRRSYWVGNLRMGNAFLSFSLSNPHPKLNYLVRWELRGMGVAWELRSNILSKRCLLHEEKGYR